MILPFLFLSLLSTFFAGYAAANLGPKSTLGFVLVAAIFAAFGIAGAILP